MHRTASVLVSLALVFFTSACKDAPPEPKPAVEPSATEPAPLQAAEYLGRARQAATQDTSLALAWLRRFCQVEPGHTSWQLLSAWGLLVELGRQGRGATILRAGGEAVSVLAYSPSGELLAVGDNQGAVSLFRPDTLKAFGKLAPAPGSPEPVEVLVFSPDSGTLAAAGASGRITLWDVAGGGPRPREIKLSARVEALLFTPDSQLLRATGAGQVLVVYVDNPALPGAGPPTWPEGTGSAPPSPPWQAKAKPDGSVILRAAATGTMPARTLTLRGHDKPVKSVVFTANGARAATADEAGAIRLWDLAMTRQPVRWAELARGKARAARLTMSGEQVLLLDKKGTLCVHRPDGGSRRCLPLKRHHGSMMQMGLSRDGRHIVMRSGSSARFWTLQSGKSRVARLEPNEVVTLSPDGGLMASSTFDGELVLRSTATGEERNRSKTRHKGNRLQDVYGITYSPRGKRLATMRADGTVQLWKADTLTPLGGVMMAGIQKPDMPVFTLDEAQLVIGEKNGRVAFWDAHKGELIRRSPKVHTGEVTAVAFAAKRALMATAGKEGQIKIWDLPARKPRGPTLSIPGGTCQDLAFTAEDRHLVCAGPKGLTTTWDLHTATTQAMRKIIDEATNIHVDDTGKVSLE